MNSLSFGRSSTIEDPENIVEELKKVFEMRHMVDIERVKLVAYQLKNVARIWFNHWNKGTDEDGPHPRWSYFKEAFLGHFYLKTEGGEGMGVLNLKQDLWIVHEYRMKFIQLSCYAPKL